uniref:Putative vasa intronic protein n=1 Tax=Corethrella appendiculata TaxID=1370023 RepID=U5EZS8_9DIPT
MENCYGIGITNRYDLFYVDDEAGDPFEALSKIKQKSQKNKLNAAAAAGGLTNQTAATGTGPQSTNNENVNFNKQNNKLAEKENKSVNSQNHAKTTNGNNNNNENNKLNNKNQTSSANNQKTENRGRGIKETQKDNIRTPREDNKGSFNKSFDRQLNNKSSTTTGNNTNNNNENREERNNRRNREQNNQNSSDDRPQRNNNNQNRRRNFDGRGKREFDRQSGSDKTGVKAIDKRDGAGAHNWGSSKQDAEDFAKSQQSGAGDYNHDNETGDEQLNNSSGTGGEQKQNETTEQQENKQPTEDDVKEMTLDEWKAQKAAVRSKPQYNLRKAGEGEDGKQWENMVALDKKKSEPTHGDDEELDATTRVNKKHVLDIEFHFNDGRRGGLMGRNRNRNRPRNANRNRDRDGDREGNHEGGPGGVERGPGGGGGGPVVGAGGGGGRRRDRDRDGNKPSGDFKFRGGKTAAPKVDDEHDFPSLG